MQGLHSFGHLGPQLVADPDRPGEGVIDGDKDAGLAFGLHALNVGLQWPGVDPPGTAHKYPSTFDGAADAMPGFLADVQGSGRFGPRCRDRSGEGVRRLLLNCRRESKHLSPIESVCRDHVGNLGLVAGKGSGLVHRQVTDAAESLERRAGFDDHAELAGRADRGHDRQRHGDCQRTRRCCDQDHQRAGDPRLGVAQQRANHADQHRQDHHPGH